MEAARRKDYASSVIALQSASRAGGVSARQMMTLEHAKQAMVADLVNRAAAGDAQAKAALAAIERTRSQ